MVFQKLAQAVEQIISEDQSPAALLSALQTSSLPASYKDMVAILTAEGLRIRGLTSEAQEAHATCINPLYRQLWRRWLERYPMKSGS
jgi:hypothetical protein